MNLYASDTRQTPHSPPAGGLSLMGTRHEPAKPATTDRERDLQWCTNRLINGSNGSLKSTDVKGPMGHLKKWDMAHMMKTRKRKA